MFFKEISFTYHLACITNHMQMKISFPIIICIKSYPICTIDLSKSDTSSIILHKRKYCPKFQKTQVSAPYFSNLMKYANDTTFYHFHKNIFAIENHSQIYRPLLWSISWLQINFQKSQSVIFWKKKRPLLPTSSLSLSLPSSLFFSKVTHIPCTLYTLALFYAFKPFFFSPFREFKILEIALFWKKKNRSTRILHTLQ